MKPIVYNIYILLMLLSYVMRRAGTFTMEDKVRMLEFISKMAQNPFHSIATSGQSTII